jgi:hypothetical protein
VRDTRMTSCAVSASSFTWCMLPTAVDCHKIIFLAVSAGDGQRGATLRIKGPAAGCSRRTTESELTVAIVCAYIVFWVCARVCVYLSLCVAVFVSVCRVLRMRSTLLWSQRLKWGETVEPLLWRSSPFYFNFLNILCFFYLTEPEQRKSLQFHQNDHL